MIFRIHDVGGQRSERRKWLYLFDCVHAVIFCVSLTNYCQKASDDAEMNKMHEAIKVGSVTCITPVLVNGVLLALQHDREQQSFSRRQYHFISQQDRHLCRSLQKVNLIRNSSLDFFMMKTLPGYLSGQPSLTTRARLCMRSLWNSSRPGLRSKENKGR